MNSHDGWQRAARGAHLLGPSGSLSPSIFAEMSALALATDSVNLGQGFPDEDGPAEVLDTAIAAIAAGANQYPPGRGTADLRAAIAEHQQRFYGMPVDPDREVLVTTGATEALAAAILALTSPGDEVVTCEPFYDAYAGLIALAGAVHRTVPLRWPDFQPDEADLRAVISDRTRVIILNTPHNPTGAVFSPAVLEVIVELAHRHDVTIVTDEVYEHLIFDADHSPLATLPGAFERTLTISSGGKTFNTTGWKIGWITGPHALIEKVLAVKQFLSYVSGAPFQPAIAAGLRLPDNYFTGLRDRLRTRRDNLAEALESAGFRISLPGAGYFIVADAAPLGVTDADRFARELPERAGLVAIPVTAFVAPENRAEYRTLMRFAFCKSEATMAEAATRVAALR